MLLLLSRRIGKLGWIWSMFDYHTSHMHHHPDIVKIDGSNLAYLVNDGVWYFIALALGLLSLMLMMGVVIVIWSMKVQGGYCEVICYQLPEPILLQRLGILIVMKIGQRVVSEKEWWKLKVLGYKHVTITFLDGSYC
jgi:hypothetical protein